MLKSINSNHTATFREVLLRAWDIITCGEFCDVFVAGETMAMTYMLGDKKYVYTFVNGEFRYFELVNVYLFELA